MFIITKPSQAQLYADFMAEIKQRLRYLRAVLVEIASDQSATDSHLKAESCYLQIRFICELIALAALSANERFGLTKKLLSQWHAGEIFTNLNKFNSACFPRPTKILRDKDGLKFEILEEGRLTQQDIVKIYHKCGAKLHRGMLKHALKGDDRLYDLTEINIWATDFIELLTEHVALVPHGNQVLVVQLFGECGNVTVATAEGIHGDSFVVGAPLA